MYNDITFNYNKTLTDAICCDMITISKFNTEYFEKTVNKRQNQYLRTAKTDVRVVRGLTNCFNYINNFIKDNT